MMKVKRIGFRSTGLATLAQVQTAKRIANEAGAEFLIEFRPCVYCGPGSAGDRGAYQVCVDGRIHTTIERDGFPS